MPNAAPLPSDVPASAPPTLQCPSSILLCSQFFLFLSVPFPNQGVNGEGGPEEEMALTNLLPEATDLVGLVDVPALALSPSPAT